MEKILKANESSSVTFFLSFAEVAQPGTARDWKSRDARVSGVRISSSAFFYLIFS